MATDIVMLSSPYRLAARSLQGRPSRFARPAWRGRALRVKENGRCDYVGDTEVLPSPREGGEKVPEGRMSNCVVFG
jgi:hypothetical protein